MAGEGRFNGNFSCLVIANLAHQNLVRVLPENGSQGAGKGHINVVIDRNLHNPINVILNRILGRDQFVFDPVQLRERGVQRGRFTRTGWAGDQNDTVGSFDHIAEFCHQFGTHADVVQIQ